MIWLDACVSKYDLQEVAYNQRPPLWTAPRPAFLLIYNVRAPKRLGHTALTPRVVWPGGEAHTHTTADT